MSDLNRLKGMSTYLCGAIDHAIDQGQGWRKEITPRLQKMGMTVYNPCSKPASFGVEVGPERERLIRLKERGDWVGLHKAMKQVVHVDLRLCQKADVLIVYLPSDTRTCGTIHEIVVAVQSKIPVLLWCPQGRSEISDWLHGILDFNYMYETMDEVIEYLKDVDNGAVILDESKWQIIDMGLVDD